METAVQPPASYSGRDPCLEQAGPSGCAKKIPKRPPLDNSANNNNNNNNNNRKRRGSFGNAHDKFKRRRRNDIVLPTKFMLGGNITDPLNLRSLENEEVNRLANQTPVASPAPAAGGGSERVEVIIPQNINDPLNLNGTEVIRPPPQPVKKDRRNKRSRPNNRRRHQEDPQNLEAARKSDGANDDNGCNTGSGNSNNYTNNSNNSSSSNNNNNNCKNPRKNSKKYQAQRFRYGNYNRYYGYRNPGDSDSRLALMKKKWFLDKSCLDIGCNVGHVTLNIARDHEPKQMIGLDIDPDLIRIAKKNVRHYLHQKDTEGRWFPASCPMTFGPIAISGAQAGFPHNVFFIAGNYVLESDEMLETQKEEFDTIMCLSTSKWMQLNFGDSGIKRVFHRIFRQLKPGGRFILEPQPLSSYSKLGTPDHRENFRKMKFMPDMYPDFLVNEVGFASFKVLGVGSHAAKGFRRPLYLFRKAKAVAADAAPDAAPVAAPVPEDQQQQPPEPPDPSPAHECDTTTASI
ncbi:probable RNA methyltransferase Y17G7B.18 [Galendromus occidentalis]|uniref:RNA methyltransferase n=1 Tax=Galendromus occidentalis TaxID=34638 RepID=A0AAJ6VXW7_9ACAR|nr:probable RNA methyltransferase Y17G7B.18 [Galendromus occidentalis]